MADHAPHHWAVNPEPTFHEDVANAIVITPDSAKKPTKLRFEGSCPFCLGETDYTHQLRLIPSVATAPKGQGIGELTITVLCTCEEGHPNRPPNESGCGQSWTHIIKAVR